MVIDKNKINDLLNYKELNNYYYKILQLIGSYLNNIDLNNLDPEVSIIKKENDSLYIKLLSINNSYCPITIEVENEEVNILIGKGSVVFLENQKVNDDSKLKLLAECLADVFYKEIYEIDYLINEELVKAKCALKQNTNGKEEEVSFIYQYKVFYNPFSIRKVKLNYKSWINKN